jgi:hypothetical protein
MAYYDRVDYHEDGALAAGQPIEQAAAHIGLFLQWLIRRDLHSPEMIPEAHVAAVRDGRLTGSDLMDDIDGKLGSFDVTAEGAAFTGFMYDRYLDAFNEEFAEDGEYATLDDAASYVRIAPRIDALWETWVAAGRPIPPTEPESEPANGPAWPPDREPTLEQIDAINAEMVESMREAGYEVHAVRVDQLPRPHASPAAEAGIPVDLTDPPLELSSVPASRFGSSLLNRALKTLGVAAKDATVISGVGGSGESTLMVARYIVPGVPADRLLEVMALGIHAPSGRWVREQVGDKQVAVSRDRQFVVMYYARDGVVTDVGASIEAEADVRRAIERLD